MFKKIRGQKGFTLIEMLVSMAIFVAFTGILISSYTDIVKAQREANDYRIMYVEARHVFETLTQELRDGMVDYGFYEGGLAGGSQETIRLISKDMKVKTEISYDDGVDDEVGDGVIKMGKSIKEGSSYLSTGAAVQLNSDEVKITKFKIYVSPLIDPYDQNYVDYDVNQFHPKVTIYAEFERELNNGKIYKMELQTTVSSRIYNQIYST